MSREASQAQINRAVTPLLEKDERILESGLAWVTEPRSHVPTMLLARTVLGVVLTDRRLFVVDRPRRRPAAETDVVLNTYHEACRLLRDRTWTPMQHLRIRRADGRELVLEFRPHDRPFGRALAAAIPRPAASGELTPDAAAEPDAATQPVAAARPDATATHDEESPSPS